MQTHYIKVKKTIEEVTQNIRSCISHKGNEKGTDRKVWESYCKYETRNIRNFYCELTGDVSAVTNKRSTEICMSLTVTAHARSRHCFGLEKTGQKSK